MDKDQPKKLFEHRRHQHVPANVNGLHAAEQASAGVNQRVALGMTKLFSAMPTFWLILAWIVLWILANATLVQFDPMPWPLLLCLASVPQLPLMIVIMVGQGLLGRKQELQSEEQYKTTLATYHDLEQMIAHLDRQDQELLKQTELLISIVTQLKEQRGGGGGDEAEKRKRTARWERRAPGLAKRGEDGPEAISPPRD